MPKRIAGAGSTPVVMDVEQGAAAAPSPGSGRFAEVLRAGAAGASAPVGQHDPHGAGRAMLRDAVRSITDGERMVDRAIRSARRGHVFSHEELLALQAGVYRYTQELELASKLVDKATGAVRQTLQSQQ